MPFQALPALLVIALQLRRFQRLPGRPDHLGGFEHEGHGAVDHPLAHRLELVDIGTPDLVLPDLQGDTP